MRYMRFTHFLSALLANLLIVSTLTAQELPFRNFSDWGYVSTEYFDVYFAGDQEEAAVKVAKYAELARFELGVLYDYNVALQFFLFLNFLSFCVS